MNSPYSIHHISSHIVEKQISGHSYSVPALCNSLSEKINVHLHTTKPNKLIAEPSFNLHEYEINKIFNLALSSKQFKNGLKEKVQDGDIIHNHMLWRMPNIYPLHIKKSKRISLITSPRGSMSKEALQVSEKKKLIFNKLSNQNNMLSSCDAFHATSNKEKNEIRSLGYKQPIAVIKNGVDIPILKKTNFAKEKTKFLYLGRIHPIKGLDLLIRTWYKIEAQHKNCTLEICGYYEDIEYYNSLKELIKKLGLQNIYFSDKVSGDEKQKKYIDNDVFIIPSKSENFGLVIAEAMSHGLPVIVSEETPWHIVKKNNYGWVVSLNEDDIYLAISEANTCDKTDLKDMGNFGRKYIEENFSWNVLSKDYLTFYDWVRNGGTPPHFMDIL